MYLVGGVAIVGGAAIVDSNMPRKAALNVNKSCSRKAA